MSSRDGWLSPPVWPPDVFAVTATLAKQSECYGHGSVRGGTGLGSAHAATTRAMGQRWLRAADDPKLVGWREEQWRTLLKAWETPVQRCARGQRLERWAVAALRLLAAADEACAGVGFGRATLIARVAEKISVVHDRATIAWLIDPTECCVQPKARTPGVGCNLRSLSLHLALLPASTMVVGMHLNQVAHPGTRRRKSHGVLVVPYPFVVSDRDFGGKRVAQQGWGHLRLGCDWGKRPTAKELAAFVRGLLREARQNGRETNILVFPEFALSRSQLEAVWKEARRNNVSLMIAGAHVPSRVGTRNLAVGRVRGESPEKDIAWEQSKHHRWCVEAWQIANYGLPLDRDLLWWEDIDITRRTVVAARFSSGATVACLVCEDLARVEPAQPVLRDMGPNLIVALLMDGPQLATRWAAKSATVFADDPGSSVLVVTSLGLVRRYQRFRDKHDGSASPSIALWQEPGRPPVPICLPPNAHAIHLRLHIESAEEVTLDGRRDGGTAEVFRLGGRSISHRKGVTRPPWPPAATFAPVVHPDPPQWAVPLYRDS